MIFGFRDSTGEQVELDLNHYEALLFVLVGALPRGLSRRALTDQLGSLGLEPDREKFEDGLAKMRRRGALDVRALPQLRLSKTGRFLMQTVKGAWDKQAEVRYPLPVEQALAALIRIDTLVEVAEEHSGVAGGWTFDELRAHFTDARARYEGINDFDEWLLLFERSGLGFWYGGRLYFALPGGRTQVAQIFDALDLAATGGVILETDQDEDS